MASSWSAAHWKDRRRASIRWTPKRRGSGGEGTPQAERLQGASRRTTDRPFGAAPPRESDQPNEQPAGCSSDGYGVG